MPIPESYKQAVLLAPMPIPHASKQAVLRALPRTRSSRFTVHLGTAVFEHYLRAVFRAVPYCARKTRTPKFHDCGGRAGRVGFVAVLSQEPRMETLQHRLVDRSTDGSAHPPPTSPGWEIRSEPLQAAYLLFCFITTGGKLDARGPGTLGDPTTRKRATRSRAAARCFCFIAGGRN